MDFNNIIIDKNIVLKFLGYSKRTPPAIIRNMIDKEISNINNLLDIKVYIEEIDLNNHEFKGEYIQDCFKSSKKAYAILYTIGAKIEEKIQYNINNNDMMRGLILDKVGIVALDYINENIKSYLANINNGLNISHEIYPGDKGFDVENQKHIYNYLINEHITINEYNQMNPIKSIAMVICMGLCKNLKSRCENCNNKCYE